MSRLLTLTRPPAPAEAADPPGRLRRRMPRPSRRVVLAVAVSVLVLLGASGWLLGFSSALAAQRVVVSGTSALTSAEVRSAAQVAIGHPVARQDVQAIAERVAALREVESVRVSRDWPNSIRIAVVERTPVLAVPEGGRYSLVDRFGLSYRLVSSVPDGVAVAQVSSSDPGLLREVNAVVQALPDPLVGRVATVVAHSRDSISLVLGNSDRIVWGSAEQSDLKAQVVVPLMKQDASVYDVSAPQSPATR